MTERTMLWIIVWVLNACLVVMMYLFIGAMSEQKAVAVIEKVFKDKIIVELQPKVYPSVVENAKKKGR